MKKKQIHYAQVETLTQSYKHLSSGGKLVIYGFHSMLPKTGGKIHFLFYWDEREAKLVKTCMV